MLSVFTECNDTSDSGADSCKKPGHASGFSHKPPWMSVMAAGNFNVHAFDAAVFTGSNA